VQIPKSLLETSKQQKLLPRLPNSLLKFAHEQKPTSEISCSSFRYQYIMVLNQSWAFT
jgi:hypothetical protein